jgi:hypothetical protein
VPRCAAAPAASSATAAAAARSARRGRMSGVVGSFRSYVWRPGARERAGRRDFGCGGGPKRGGARSFWGMARRVGWKNPIDAFPGLPELRGPPGANEWPAAARRAPHLRAPSRVSPGRRAVLRRSSSPVAAPAGGGRAWMRPAALWARTLHLRGQRPFTGGRTRGRGRRRDPRGPPPDCHAGASPDPSPASPRNPGLCLLPVRLYTGAAAPSRAPGTLLDVGDPAERGEGVWGEGAGSRLGA